MYPVKKWLLRLLILALALSLTACSGGKPAEPTVEDDPVPESPGVTGEIQSYGDFAAVLVPEG